MVYVTGSHLDYKYTEGESPGVYRGETVPRPLNRDFKIGHYGRLGRLGRCHVTQKTGVTFYRRPSGTVCFRRVSRREDNGETVKSYRIYSNKRPTSN